jgi:hypothetical protein
VSRSERAQRGKREQEVAERAGKDDDDGFN